jgi:DNA repair exonuclease SbcCD ATPase subunit
MKIRSITLSDIRQFTRPVTVGGFAAGLNVLAAPNEAGKSTLFDAIHALFFIPHRSSRIAHLRPEAGGTPEIRVELDLPDGPCTIVKRWGRGAMAEVIREGHVIARADAAEAFVAGLTAPAEEGGPAGLLWVRQGVIALDDGSRKEAEGALLARRDLMSSVTGEFENVTGGRRMDRALARAEADLERLVTLRGPKAGGPYDRAKKAVESLTATRDDLAQKQAALRDALDRRRAARADLAQWSDPSDVAHRTQRLVTAQAAHEEATRHAERLAGLQATADHAALRASQAETDLRRLTEAEAALRAAHFGAQSASEEAQAAEGAHHAALAALTDCRAAVEAARAGQEQAEAVLAAAHRANAQKAAQRRRAELSQRLALAEELTQRLLGARAAAQTGPEATAVAALERAETTLAVLERQGVAAAPQIVLRYLPGVAARASLDGAPLEGDSPRPVLAPLTLSLPGLGALSVTPGQTVDARGLAEARATRDRARAETGCTDLPAARVALATRASAQEAVALIEAQLRGLVPEGVDALKAELATLPETPETTAPVDLAAAEDQARQARATLEAARQTEARAAGLESEARTRALRATIAAEATARALQQAEATLTAFGPVDDARPTLAAALAAATSARDAARASHAAMAETAPDPSATAAALSRARSVVEAAEREVARLGEDLVRLETLIDVHAGNGVEEELADCEARLARAGADLAAHEHEVAVLRCLIAALTEAQATARDRYFAPVMAELRPMLRLLWPGAELRFDGESLLPTQLIRGGRAEEIGTLSGGTREQIALLLRLAFARLLAKSGRHAPVILDDALVYSDDDRIERMFDALHQQAGDIQIIVLSCRNRAFRDLGGQKLIFTEAGAA